MIIALVARDLIIASRIAEAAARAGVDLRRFDEPSQLPPAGEVDLLVVDWGDREPEWGAQLAAWQTGGQRSQPPRIILFGPHVDLEAHAHARAVGLGPMWARSKLMAKLPTLFG